MTACMESELQGRFENIAPHLIIQELYALYAKHARTERYVVTDGLAPRWLPQVEGWDAA